MTAKIPKPAGVLPPDSVDASEIADDAIEVRHLSSGVTSLLSGGWQLVVDHPIAGLVWDIAHNLNGFPNVTVVDTAGTVFISGVEYIDENNLRIVNSAPFSGKVYLS